MALFDERELKKHIKAGAFLTAYLFVGDESYLKNHYSNLIVQRAVPETLQSLNLDFFEGKGLDLRDALERAMLLPMMSERRCILVDDYKLDPLPAQEFKLLEKALGTLPETTILIFRQDQCPVTKKASGKKIVDLFEKYGAVCELNKRTGKDLYQPLIASAAKQNRTLSPVMAQYLVASVGDDFNVLRQELAKVCSYGEGEITKAQIDAVAVKTLDAKVNDLVRALLQNNFEKAYLTLDTLLRQRTEPNYILGSIIGTYAEMYRAKVAMACDGSIQPLLDTFPYKGREFALRYAVRDGAKLELSQLRQCLEILRDADLKMKSAVGGAEVIEQLMVRLLLIANGERV